MNQFAEQVAKAFRMLRWLPAYAWQQLTRRQIDWNNVHLIIAVADHFEPSFLPDDPQGFADREEQKRRVEQWCRLYPAVVDRWRDTDGRPLRHTYFYPAEQYDRVLVERLADHCRLGWGEIEIQLHHGVVAPDTPENTRRTLIEFRDTLAGHGCLSRWQGSGTPAYAFVHGNWALANSGGGRYCGVDTEMQILAETGCYADFTLPSAPNPAQVRKINSLYECGLPLDQPAPHRRGTDLCVSRPVRKLPLIVQGPLGLNFGRRTNGRRRPCIENGALTTANPPTMTRLRLWQRAGIIVRGRPDWLFIKLHCHGMDPRDEPAMLGEPIRRFLDELTRWGQANRRCGIHFVTAREMVNIILAACDGRTGDPGQYREYRLRLQSEQRGAIQAEKGHPSKFGALTPTP